jgi:hypothetical protein
MARNPQFGFNTIRMQRELAENPKNVASCQLNGNKMSLKWGDGIVQNVNVEFKTAC